MFTRVVTKSRLALLLSLGFLAAACGSSGYQSSAPANSAPASTASAGTTAVSAAANPDFGKILTDHNGMTLYFFDNDKPIKPQSSCTGACAKAWPIVPASDGTAVGNGVDASKLGQVTRSDGQTQLTYNNWPLYRFSGDSAAGQTNGQGIMGIWHVAGVDGKPITAAMVQTTEPSGSGGY